MIFYNFGFMKKIFASAFLLSSINLFSSPNSGLESESQKQSYSMGVVVGKQILGSIDKDDFKIDKQAFGEGLLDSIYNKKIKLSNDEIQKNLLSFTKKQTESYSSQVEEKAKEHVKSLINTDGVPVIGDPKANISIVEFFDYNCGHCKLMAKPLKDLVKSNKDVKVLLRNYPIMGKNSNYAAKAVLWAMQKNSKKESHISLHDSFLKNNSMLKKQEIKDIINSSGLDSQAFEKELNALNLNKLIEDNFKLASELGLKGTPSLFFINEKTGKVKFMSGAVTSEAELQKVVDELK